MELIAYYRVSTAQQARAARSPGPLLDPGYRVVPALEAQRAAVARLRRELERRRGVAVVVGGFTEIEPSAYRPQLGLALAEARKRGAVVVVARLHRLGNDADLLERLELEADRAQLKAGRGGGFGGFLFADLPAAYAFENARELRVVLGLAAALARLERDSAAQRIREGLATAKARGKRLGGLRPGTVRENARAKEAAASRSEALRPILAPLAAEGASFGEMARALYAAGTRTAKGEALSRSAVKRHLERLGLIA
ncbi:MAG: recombinase family protein [Cyanobacteria bacterium REEB498]|nr:recombinase family protein [Cyanobacteria bacterium REEB498]